MLTLFALLGAALSLGQSSLSWHTRPDKWKEPRLFHTPFQQRYEERIAVSHVPQSEEFKFKLSSPNRAYWFGISPDVQSNQTCRDKVEFEVFTPDARICVFNERDYLIEITLKDHYPNFLMNASWVSEKLLFVRVWWGRVLGTDFIFDVEQESFVYREMFNDGNIPFMQFQHLKQKSKPR
jgi:hypothetical protein